MEEPSTHIQVCGRLHARWRGEPIEQALRGRQGRLLFAFLVLNRNRPARRDELVEAVWPDERLPAGGDGNLAPLLSRLRKVVGPDSLEGRQDVRLVLPEDAYVDWEALLADVERSRAATSAGDAQAGWEAARAALVVAERGLLPGLEAPWIDEHRAQLADLRVEALELAARSGLRLGGVELLGAERAVRQAVEAAPFRESTRAAAMQVLRAQGNVAEALRVYEDIRVLLRDELGTTPGPELVALHEELLRGEPAPAPEPRSRPPAPAAGPGADPPALPDLVERERELAELVALLAEAREDQGRVAVIEGPAGVGKTRLLAEARRRAAAGALALGARAGELERDFPFGVVRQLFEGEIADPARRAALLDGAAAPAAVVFGGDAATPESADISSDGSFAVLHGLFWLTLNLAAERPLVLAVDDLHWCDRPSLRFFAYLVRRLEGVPLLLAATLRTGEESTDPAILDEILHDPATVPIRPGPLSLGATRVVVRARLGAEAADAFCAACHETTGGNPLLLRQLLTALRSDGVRPDTDNVAVVRRIGPRAVSRTIGLRLARMSPETVSVARAIAVLGERAELPTVAAMAEIDEDVAGRAVAALARAEVLRPEPPLGFVHPLVRDAVHGELPVGEVEVQHARAAQVLADAGAPDDVVAVHLMLAPRRGDEWAAGVLQRAGVTASRQGAADSAVALMRRALEEPAPPAVRPRLLLDLGLAEKLVDGVAAAEHLRSAYEELTDPEARALAAYALAWTLFFVGVPDETAAFMRRAADEQPPELIDTRWALEALNLLTSLGHGVDLSAYEDRLRHARGAGLPTGTGPGAKMLFAVAAWGWAVTGGPADECAALALRGFEGHELIEVDDGLVVVAGIAVLVLADRPEALEIWDRVLAEAHRSGSLFLTCTVHIWRGWALLWRGELAEAAESLEQGFEELNLWGSGKAVLGYPAAFLALANVERGDLAAARAALTRAGDQPEGSDSRRFMQTSEIEILLAEGRPEEGLALAERVERSSARHTNPAWAGWRSLKVRCLAALGRREEAVALAEEELAVSRAWGAPGVVGRAVRLLATVQDDGRIERFEESVALLEGTPSRLELAKSLAALGGALRRAGRPDEARGPLARALVLGEASGAEGLAEDCRAQLEAAGASPGEPAIGVAALTDAERRVAALAAEGLDARTIAQAVFGTPRAVEHHLASAHRKLGVEDAQELGRALAGAAG